MDDFFSDEDPSQSREGQEVDMQMLVKRTYKYTNSLIKAMTKADRRMLNNQEALKPYIGTGKKIDQYLKDNITAVADRFREDANINLKRR